MIPSNDASSSTVPTAEIRHWMFEVALPLWADAGVDRLDGGFVEQLDFAGHDAGVDFKRTRVTCRQIYVFAHASLLGWRPGLVVAEHGFEFLLRSRQADDGWPRTVDRQGRARDVTPDLYDLAFVLFALGWYVRATGDASAATLARQTLSYVERHMRPAEGEGFWHQTPPSGWRQQNPHMHLLEAMLVCFEATGEDRYATIAKELVGLFSRRLFDSASSTLAEYFADGWSRAPGDPGRIVEPGHQFEWAWILANYARLFGEDTSASVRGLVAFAERFGVDQTSAVTLNQVRDDGAPIDRGSRAWPNTERIKGHIALESASDHDATGPIARSTRLLLDRYLAVQKPGLWVDAFDGAGRPVSETAPASTLYHLFLAFAEVLRTRSPSSPITPEKP